MYAVEFKTEIKNGSIKIPKQFKAKLKGNVKVILLTEYLNDSDEDIIEELLAYPIKIDDFKPYDREELYER